MALINSASKSSRLLASRRYTHDTFTDAQESFTNVLDLQASEIYTQAKYIPSSGLPFSSSADHGSIHQASGSNLMKYWYRHKLTPSNVNTETWLFLNPTGSDDGVGAQLINDNQQTNFISPKYSISSLANAITEDTTPGYGVVVYKSSTYTQTSQTGSLDSDDKVSANDYIFDYKTGVLQFLNSSVDPASNEVVFMTAYQYVGKTLETGLDITGDITASNMLLSGNLTLGGGSGDTIEVSAEYSGSIIPDVDNAFDLGSSSQKWKDIYSAGTITGSAVYGTTIGQNRTDGLKTITIEDTSYINQDLTTDANVTFNHITASGNISASGTIYADNFQSTGGSVEGISFTDDINITGNMTASGDISGSATSTGSFGHILTSGGISSSGQVDINSDFAQLRLSDDGFNDYIRLGQSGTVGYIKTSDSDNNFKFRRGSDNTDLLEIYFGTERVHISGSGGLDVTGHVTASGNISASGNIYGANITASGGFNSSDIHVDDYIYHNGDPDTYIGFPTGDKVDIKAGGINFIHAWQKDDDIDKLWFNKNQDDVNFRFYTPTNSPGLQISASGDVGIHGIQNPSASLHVGGNVLVDSHVTASGNISSSGDVHGGSVTSTGTITGSAVYGTTIGQNRTDGLKTITIEANSTVNQDLTTDANPTFADLTLTGDLTVRGDTTTLSTTNLKVGDQFIFTATGSAASNVDGGLIVQSGSAVDSGSAIYHDTQDERWAVAKGVASDGTAVTPTSYVTTTTTANHNPNTDSGSYGSGEMWINTTDEEIWVRTG